MCTPWIALSILLIFSPSFPCGSLSAATSGSPREPARPHNFFLPLFFAKRFSPFSLAQMGGNRYLILFCLSRLSNRLTCRFPAVAFNHNSCILVCRFKCILSPTYLGLNHLVTHCCKAGCTMGLRTQYWRHVFDVLFYGTNKFL